MDVLIFLRYVKNISMSINVYFLKYKDCLVHYVYTCKLLMYKS